MSMLPFLLDTQFHKDFRINFVKDLLIAPNFTFALFLSLIDLDNRLISFMRR